MVTLYWNCRDLARATAMRRLRALFKQSNPDYLCLAETKSMVASGILNKVGFSLVSEVPARGSRGWFDCGLACGG